jgi:hypothetical protein
LWNRAVEGRGFLVIVGAEGDSELFEPAALGTFALLVAALDVLSSLYVQKIMDMF